MVDVSLLLLFIPTFFLVSLTPGLCMTLAMSLGSVLGYRKTLWMMLGELLGVALVAISCVIGVATIVLNFPLVLTFLKIIGALYLCYVGYSIWHSSTSFKVASVTELPNKKLKYSLFAQGFITAISNPKGWAFMISLLPPFINETLPLTPQLSILVSIILMSEFICMSLYALGGKTLAKVLAQKNKLNYLNKVSGGLMMIVALWLIVS